ncbi:FAD:protein FMN transferase [Glaciihabitans arcticus]|uniref:FAD:protein FMN transferase n=1 Tax=Glaciihabitans arcticus TaxID=2668039 RepID=A0A4Q9GZB8_9MICO|nr:FAD:protein FMN transferase [Glaciihabitans arcticus]TBN57740.1 FAD:protein FMN transferase [Glaciihabitans arcticus]
MRSRLTPSPRLPHRLAFEAIGAPWSIETAEPVDPELAAAIDARIESFDRTWSRFRDDSLVSRIAREPGVYRLPPEAGALLDVYRALYEATDGAVSPLVGRSLERLGYNSAYTLRDSGERGPAPEWSSALAWDGESLSALRPVTLDVGAAGKGYLVDLVAALLREAGHTEFVVDASGDLAHAGSEHTRVGLEHPLDATKAIGIALVGNQALAASASNRRAWGDGLHHVIDATTGLPTSNVIATWVVAPTGLLADGLATGLFFAPADSFSALGPFEWVRMFSTGRVEHSPHLQGELFL